MKFINRMRNKIHLWLINKLIKDPYENCPFWDDCHEYFKDTYEPDYDDWRSDLD